MHSFKWRWLVVIHLVSVAAANPLEVAGATTTSSVSGTGGRTYCGAQLVEALKYVCITFPSIFQRPSQSQGADNEKERMTLVEACCYRKCNLTYLKQYCEKSKNVTLEVTTREPLAVQVNSGNVVEEVMTEAPAVPEVIFINVDSEPLTIIPRYTSPNLASYLYDHYETRAIF